MKVILGAGISRCDENQRSGRVASARADYRGTQVVPKRTNLPGMTRGGRGGGGAGGPMRGAPRGGRGGGFGYGAPAPYGGAPYGGGRGGFGGPPPFMPRGGGFVQAIMPIYPS